MLKLKLAESEALRLVLKLVLAESGSAIMTRLVLRLVLAESEALIEALRFVLKLARLLSTLRH